MMKFALEVYAAISAFATIAYVALGWASSKKAAADELERTMEFDEFMGRRLGDLGAEGEIAFRGWGPDDRVVMNNGQHEPHHDHIDAVPG